MGHYVRILGTQDPDISVDELISALKEDNLRAQFELLDSEQSNKWTILEVANSKGEALVQIERNPVIEGELGREELDEFIEEIEDEKPASAVTWLTNTLRKSKLFTLFKCSTLHLKIIISKQYL